MPFTLRCVQYKATSGLQNQQYMVGVRSLLVDEEVLLMKKALADISFRWLMKRFQKSSGSYGPIGMCQ